MSVDPNQVVYAIQVYENDSAYYYGLFDEVDSLKITLMTTKSYRFKIAPQGWHVPSKEEWATLISFLGGDSLAGGKMKEKGTLHWDSPNMGADNSSGFNVLPAGYRQRSTGVFLYKGAIAYFRTTTEELGSGYDSAWNVKLYYQNTQALITYAEKTFGFSVRCIKD